MKLPGSCGEKSKKIAKLDRTICDLKQSGRKWGHLCAHALIADGFEQCKVDPCIFHKIVDGVVIMTIDDYVDDLAGRRITGRLRIVTVVAEQEVSNERLRRVHLVRWVWHREERRVRNDQVVARSMRRELDDTL